jgi:hypothetical protein
MEALPHEMFVTWPLRCSQFNHGWLRNRFCQSLGAAIQIAGGKVERDLPQDAHLAWIQDWVDHEDTAKRLIADFVNEMSPAVLFSITPLANLNPSDAEFFRTLAHSLWFKRHNIGVRTEYAKAALALAGERVQDLGQTHSLREAMDSGLVVSLHAACQRLADSLSQLPKSIEL